MNPEDLFYTKEHEWIRVAGDTGTVGITDHAQATLGGGREDKERVVLGQRHRLLGPQLLIQAPAQQCVRLQERPPVLEMRVAGRRVGGALGVAGHATMIAHPGDD